MGLYQNILDVISPGALTTNQDIPIPGMEQMLPPVEVMANSLPNEPMPPAMMANASPQMMPQQPPQQPGILKQIFGGNNQDFNRMLLASGAGMLSAPGAKGLGQAAENVAGVMDSIQKRKDDQMMKQAKIDKLRADIARGLAPKVTSDGMGGVYVTPSDGSPPYRMTDEEYRAAKMGVMNTQSTLNTQKLDKLKQDIEKGYLPKPLGKMGDDSWVVQKADGTLDTISSDEMKAAGLRMNEGKLERAAAAAAAKEAVRAPTPAEVKQGIEVRQQARKATDAVKEYEKILGVVGENGENAPDMIYKLDPTGIYAKINRAAGTKQATVDLNLAKIKKLEAFSAEIGSQAQISNYEREILMAPIPQSGDDGKIIAEAIREKIQVLKDIAERAQAEAESLPGKMQQGASAVAPKDVANAIKGTPGDKPVNNPGNLRPAGKSTGFQQFPTIEAGVAATKNQLRIYDTRGKNTVRQIISTWSPPNENDTAILIENAAKRLGVQPDQKLDLKDEKVLEAVAQAIFAQEGNLKKVQDAQKTTRKPLDAFNK